jgi:hypothetical protein
MDKAQVTHEVLFSASYRYRNAYSLKALLAYWTIAMFACAVLGFGTTLAIWEGHFIAGVATCAALIAAVIVAATFPMLIYAWVSDRTIILEISGDGVRYGNHFWPWKDIGSLTLRTFGNGSCAFSVRERGWRRVIHPCLVQAPMTQLEAMGLVYNVRLLIATHGFGGQCEILYKK